MRNAAIVETISVVSYLDRGIVNCLALVYASAVHVRTDNPDQTTFSCGVALSLTWQMLPWF